VLKRLVADGTLGLGLASQVHKSPAMGAELSFVGKYNLVATNLARVTSDLHASEGDFKRLHCFSAFAARKTVQTHARPSSQRALGALNSSSEIEITIFMERTPGKSVS
jgi:hypothetical protein